MTYLGEIAGLCTALCWTGSSFTFALASRRAGGFATNQFRLWAALPVLVLLVWIATGEPWPWAVETWRITLLLASGLVGLVLGDIGYFYALSTIGPRISSVLMATWPAMAVGLAAFGGEWPTWWTLFAMSLVMLGVVLVLLRGREGSAWNPSLTPRTRLLAVLGALLGALGQAGGTVLARHAMAPGDDLEAGVDPLAATLVRMAAAAVGLQLLAIVRRQATAFLDVVRQPQALRAALFGTVFGPIVGVFLSMFAVRYSQGTGVAAVLMATTPIFMMPLAAYAYGARIGLLGSFGTLLAVGGAALLLVG